MPLGVRVQQAIVANDLATQGGQQHHDGGGGGRGGGGGGGGNGVGFNVEGESCGIVDESDTTMAPEALLQAAWREQRRDPTVALALAETARRRARAGGAPTELYQRAAFLCGKLLTEAYCDFDAGAALLAEAVAAHPDGWPGRQVRE